MLVIACIVKYLISNYSFKLQYTRVTCICLGLWVTSFDIKGREFNVFFIILFLLAVVNILILTFFPIPAILHQFIVFVTYDALDMVKCCSSFCFVLCTKISVCIYRTFLKIGSHFVWSQLLYYLNFFIIYLHCK